MHQGTSDDTIASFSSTGPTAEGVKPDVLAAGGHILSMMSPLDQLPREHPEFYDSNLLYFSMSGTSQSAAVAVNVWVPQE